MNTPSKNPDFSTLAGLIVALGSVLGGLVLEGGSIRDIAQLTAALIVLGGTAGAIMISAPLQVITGALRSLKSVFFDYSPPAATAVDGILRLATKARKTGITSLELDALKLPDPFFQKALNLAVDNTPVADIRTIMEIDMDQEEYKLEAQAKVFECAGGYAPTVGIIGAVLGLIQVMKHLENIDEVGRGIAVSFVATVYGVALANLILLPAAAKLKARAAHLLQIRELTLEGVICIAEGLNPTLLRLRLDPYLPKSRAAQRLAPAPQPRAEASAA